MKSKKWSHSCFYHPLYLFNLHQFPPSLLKLNILLKVKYYWEVKYFQIIYGILFLSITRVGFLQRCNLYRLGIFCVLQTYYLCRLRVFLALQTYNMCRRRKSHKSLQYVQAKNIAFKYLEPRFPFESLIKFIVDSAAFNFIVNVSWLLCASLRCITYRCCHHRSLSSSVTCLINGCCSCWQVWCHWAWLLCHTH